MTEGRHTLGRDGEDVAAHFLERKGYVILERNFRSQHAEIDIVCLQPRSADRPAMLVFVEVKTASSSRWGTPEDAVSPGQQRRLLQAAEAFLYERKVHKAYPRFDVITVTYDRETPSVRHLENALWFDS